MPIRKPTRRQTQIRVHEEAQLLTFLLQKMGGMSRTSAKLILSHRQVLVNGVVQTNCNLLLHDGDELTIQTGLPVAELHHPKLSIVYEDEYLLVVEKKVGILTVPAHEGSRELTVFGLLKNYVKKSNPRGGIYVVHRLDRETSGLLVFAKTPELQEYMRTYWKQIVSRRTYVAVAEGIIEKPSGQIRTWLTEDSRNAMVYSSPVDNGGKLSITNYRVVKHSDAYSLVELNLETGRTNQIRVHLASIGHPVVSDHKYGSGQQPPIDRLALHAFVLEFVHPVTEQTVHFETPIPRDFLAIFH